MKKNNIILLIVSSPFLLGIFYFVFGIGLISSLILSLGLGASSGFLLEGLTLWELNRLTKVGVKRIKKDIDKLEQELQINTSYLEEIENFFSVGKIDKQNIKKVTDILTFKSLFHNTDIEKKVYKIQQNIDDLFNLFNEKYVHTDNLENKKDIVQKIREMNESKKDMYELLTHVKKNILGLMNKNLKSVLEVRAKLQSESDRLGVKSPLYLQQNIDTLNITIQDLEKKIQTFQERM